MYIPSVHRTEDDAEIRALAAQSGSAGRSLSSAAPVLLICAPEVAAAMRCDL